MSLNILLLNSLASQLFSYAVNLKLSFPEVQRTFCFTFLLELLSLMQSVTLQVKVVK